MSRKVTIEFCGMLGTGETKAKAKQDAMRRIEAVLSGDWNPYFLSHKGVVAIVSRAPDATAKQWDYQLAWELDRSKDLYPSRNYETRDAAIQAAAYHLAQNALSYDGLEHWLSLDRRRDLDAYFAWQAEHAKAHAEGLTDQQCRDRADAAQQLSWSAR